MNNEKTPPIYSIPKEEMLKAETKVDMTSASGDRVRNKSTRKQATLVCNLLMLAIIIVSVLFYSGMFYNLYSEYDYDPVFDKVSLASKYDDNYLPMVKIKFNDKDIVFKHNLIPYSSNKTEVKSLSFYDKINNFVNGFNTILCILLDYNYKTNDFFQLYHEDKFNFQIKSRKSDDNHITCLDVQVKNDLKYFSGGDIEACVDLKDYAWFGGHEAAWEPYWPINNQSFNYVPYVTGFPDQYGAVMERYWLSSAGMAIFFGDEVPLMVKHKNNTICFKSARSEAPYKYTSAYKSDKLHYSVCSGPIKSLHMHMLNNYLGFPTTWPDSLMMERPIFTTWNYFFKNVNQSSVLHFAHEISQNDYQIAQLEIDDNWETSYGDLDFDKKKFPNVTELTRELHEMDMRVTLWVHPFCNTHSECFLNGTNEGLWVKDGMSDNPGLTAWWNGLAAILDTTNPKSVDYFTNRLNSIKAEYGIDSFKFDAGETSWIPAAFKLFNKTAYPDAYSQNFVRMAAKQGSFIETRTAHRVQKTPIFYRILDRATNWGIHTGLQSVVTATLHFGLLGYPFVLPDIIGGNSNIQLKDKELYIRWTQLTAFLPAMQFGVPPWFFDDETNTICKNHVEIHRKLNAYIRELPLDGSPIIRPMWWLEPDAASTIFQINDQFLVGDDILVAPVLAPGLTEREVYIPEGQWVYNKESGKGCTLEGPITKNFTLQLQTIPYFTRLEHHLKNYKDSVQEIARCE